MFYDGKTEGCTNDRRTNEVSFIEKKDTELSKQKSIVEQKQRTSELKEIQKVPSLTKRLKENLSLIGSI